MSDFDWNTGYLAGLMDGKLIDEGIEMLRAANASFGNYTAEEPGVPSLGEDEAKDLLVYAKRLAVMAQEIKDFAQWARGQGRENFALLLIRVQLSVEETGEFAEALASGDLEHAAKELTDLSYVTDGHYLTLGLADRKLDLYREVHSSNMSKLDEDGKPIISEAGRWVKGPNYWEADVGSVLRTK